MRSPLDDNKVVRGHCPWMDDNEVVHGHQKTVDDSTVHTVDGQMCNT